MKKITILLLPMALLLIANTTMAQQNSLFNTYTYDPFQLNIAYAGYHCTEANVHYRSQWIGMKEAPRLLQLNAHTAIGKSTGLGLRILSQQQGLLNSTQATIGYAYRFKLNATADMHLGLGLGWVQNTFNAPKAIVIDANDATLGTGSKQKANGFDSEFGAMYLGQKLKAGLAIAHLYNSNPSFASSNYKLLPQTNVSASYLFNKDKKIEIEPWLVDRYTLNGRNVIEGLVNVHFSKMITVGAGYRTSYGILGFLGAKIGNLKVAYSFDYGTSKQSTAIGSSHQLLLGISLCKAAKPITPEQVSTTQQEPVKEQEVKAPEKEAPVTAQEAEPAKETPQAVPTPEKETQKVATILEEPKTEIVRKMNTIAEEVVFDFEKSTLNREGLEKLDVVAKWLKENPELKINIIGHTCNKGGEAYNKNLSSQRAEYVKNELFKRGVKASSIHQIIGMGAEKELYNNEDETIRPRNRTVRFEAVK